MEAPKIGPAITPLHRLISKKKKRDTCQISSVCVVSAVERLQSVATAEGHSCPSLGTIFKKANPPPRGDARRGIRSFEEASSILGFAKYVTALVTGGAQANPLCETAQIT